MAAPSKPTGTVQHLVFVKHQAAGGALTAFSNPAVYTDIVGAGKLLTATTKLNAAFLEGATGFGPIDLTGNPVSYTPLGASETKTVAGAADLGELPLRFVPTESAALDSALLGAQVGDSIEVVCVKQSGAAEVAYYAGGEISGLNVGFDTPAESEIRVALSDRPKRLVK